MRPHFDKSSIALLVCSAFIAIPALSDDWSGSYSAGGQCFCVGEIDASLKSTIVPTPVGGQTVQQVCDRVGDGPGLKLNSGLFNHPVYSDVQCGNGPRQSSLTPQDRNCAGSLDGKLGGSSEYCLSIGPEWELNKAYSKMPNIAAAEPVTDAGVGSRKRSSFTVAQMKDLLEEFENKSAKKIDGSSVVGKPLAVVGAQVTARKNISSGQYADADSRLGGFTGKSVTIDGQRYLQAREDLPARGGLPGTRIILDDQLYLRDDANLLPEDLYRKKTASSVEASVRRPAAAMPVEQEPALGAAKMSTQRQLDADATNRQIAHEIERKLADSTDTVALHRAKKRLDELALARTRARVGVSEGQKSPSAVSTSLSRFIPDNLDAKAARNEQSYSIERRASEQDDYESLAETDSRTDSVGEVIVQVDSADDKSLSNSGLVQSGISSALRLPAAVRPSSRNFSYLEALPVSYDIGGSGLMIEGSTSSHSRFQYVGNLGVTASYREFLIGAGYYLTPPSADRFTVVLLAGVEYGSFELIDGRDLSRVVDFDDTGLYVGASTRLVLSNSFELKAGVGYSSFFEGDATVFGGGYYHLTKRWDLVSRFEVGDNDLLGLGVRFYY